MNKNNDDWRAGRTTAKAKPSKKKTLAFFLIVFFFDEREGKLLPAPISIIHHTRALCTVWCLHSIIPILS